MKGDLARHEIHNGRTSLFTVDTDPSLISSFGVIFNGEHDGRDVEVLSLVSKSVNSGSPFELTRNKD